MPGSRFPEVAHAVTPRYDFRLWQWRRLAAALIVSGPLWINNGTDAQDVEHLSITQPGGVPGLPTITGIQRATNGVAVSWYGPAGYYQLFQKLNLAQPQWQPVGGPRLTNKAFVSVNSSNAMFRLSGPAPQYIGDRACTECHPATHDTVARTSHASAFTKALFVSQGGQSNQSCQACHTVGHGLPTGFISKTKTSHLAGVQCENCHGPAGPHAANPDDFTLRPRVETAATVCGGCHTAAGVPAQVALSHLPYYEEWSASGHQAVRADLKREFTSGLGRTSSITSCGRCHSGTVRAALLKNISLTSGHEAAAVGVACSTCHDSHRSYVHTNVLAGVQRFTNVLTGFRFLFTNAIVGSRYTNQLREPLASLQDFHAGGSFSTNYNPQVNTCAQCHNDRSATWMSGDRAPHPSLQYNMLLGTVGVLATGQRPAFPATHSRIEKQCVTCHMPTAHGTSGHTFAVSSYESCASCHGTAANARAFVFFVKEIIQSLSEKVKDGLDEWAVHRSPVELRKYGALAWEYDEPGRLSNPTGTLRGPVSNPSVPAKDEQRFIPANIQKARFNLYLVINDGSYGVHNGPYAITLLDAAQAWVQSELTR